MHLLLFNVSENLLVTKSLILSISSRFFPVAEDAPESFVVDIGLKVEESLVVGKSDVLDVGDEITAGLGTVLVENKSCNLVKRG